MSKAEDRELRELLLRNVMRRRWWVVVAIYRKHGPRALEMKLMPKTKDTVLHMAVIDQRADEVEQLVRQICTSGNHNALTMKNEKGNTPLHIAAALGNARMCEIIASVNPGLLVEQRNNNGETPVFLAARCGHKLSFYCLAYYICGSDMIEICRSSSDGDTALHCALRNEQLDLAFHMINISKFFVSSVNMQGLTAFHVLASRPTVFKSGCPLHGWRKMLYYCTSVEQLKPESLETLRGQLRSPLNTADPSSFPDNYSTCIHNFFTILWNGFLTGAYRSACFDFFKIIFMAIITIFLAAFGSTEIIKKMREEKQKHTWSVQLMEKLLETFFGDTTPYDSDIETPPILELENQVQFCEDVIEVLPNSQERHLASSPILIAAKNGVIEMVTKIFEYFPVAIHDTTEKKKNVLHFAAEYRQPEVFKLLVAQKYLMENVFQVVDIDGNSALHLAAQAPPTPKLWGIAGTALQMQWEVKWYQFVKECVPREFCTRRNEAGKTPDMIFQETHKGLVDEGKSWLISTSNSCSVVAALVATVAFASAATVPGGNGDNGYPVLEKNQVFFIYSISSLIALCLSSTSVIMFLAILTSRFEAKDFASNLPWKLFIGLSSLYFSIIAMIVSFCAGHFFLLTHRIQNIAVLLYVFIFLPVTIIFAMTQLPLYFDLLQALRTKVPKMSADIVQYD